MTTAVLKNILFTLALASYAFNASAEWKLKNKESTVNFISIKKLTTGEVHSFRELQGLINNNGDVNVTVKLASVETNIPIRNDRMQQFLFEVIKFPKATVSTKVKLDSIENMKIGDSFLQKLSFKLSIHGQDQNVNANVRITLLSGNKLLVTTVQPIIINASDFELVAGVEKLKELAKLPSISTAIPVTVSFIFEKRTS